MTEACYLARGARPLIKPTTCEECFTVSTCKMYANYKQLELTLKGYEELLRLKQVKWVEVNE
jgi:hypothetical protein